MTLEAKSSLLDLEAYYRNDINTSELEDFRSSLRNIESKASAACDDLVAWKATNSKPPPQIGLNKGPKAASIKTAPTRKGKRKTKISRRGPPHSLRNPTTKPPPLKNILRAHKGNQDINTGQTPQKAYGTTPRPRPRTSHLYIHTGQQPGDINRNVDR